VRADAIPPARRGVAAVRLDEVDELVVVQRSAPLQDDVVGE
jgi:hypothetical protein